MIHHRALRAISARSRRLRRQHHRALSSPPAESNNDREELLRCIPSVYSQRCRARSGSEASPSFRRLPLKGVWRSRGFHASTRTRLIEDRDGRGLTEEIIEENLDRKRGEAMKQNDAYVESALLTTRKEALSLYRAVIRASVLFVWRDTKGRVWKDVIRESARKEFEQGKHERDPEIVNRLILSGREAVDVALDKFMEQRQKIMDEESKGVPGGGFKS